MRTGVDGGTFGYYNSQRFGTWERVKVANGSGTMVDVSMRFTGYNLQLPQPNLPIGALTVDFARDASPSLAPFVVASTLNRLNDGTTYSPLLQIGRTVTMEIAIGEPNSNRPADGSSLWYEVFRGTIASVKWPQFGSHVASITVLDLGGVLQKMKSQAEYTYMAGTAIETVAQQILTNNGATWVSFSCPVATGKVLPNDVKPGLQKTVWEQLANLFRQAGMVLWWRYTGNSTLQLVAFEPPRNKTVVDQSFSIVTDYTQLEIDENDIGSTGYIVYYDGNGVQQTIGPMVDSASVAKYGGQYGMQRPFWIVLTADSPVRDGTSALALLTQALSDVADPDVVATVTMPPLWFGEAAVDLYEFPTITGWLFDSPLEAAPFAISIQRQGDQQPYTSVSVRGKPSAGRKTWQIVGGGQIITSYGLNGSNLILADTIDSFQLGATVPYVSAGGATDAWPRRPFTVHTAADLTDWSLGGLFLEDVGNVALHGPRGLENYLRFQNTNTLSGPNLGIISNAELQGYGGVVAGLSLFTGALVINSNAGAVTGALVMYDAGGVARVTGATSVVSGNVIGFRGTVPATHAAVTGESWNLYMSGTAPNYFAARTYWGSTTDTAYLERSSAGILSTGAQLNAASFAVNGSTVITSGQVLQNVTANASILTAGTLAYARLPTGGGTWDTAGGTIQLNGLLSTTGGLTASGAVTGLAFIPTTGGSLAAGRIVRRSDLGMVLYGTAGSSRSFALLNDLGNQIFSCVAGSVVCRTENDHFVGRNLTLGNAGVGGGVGVFGLLDATTAPTSTPAGGSVVWSAGGVLKTRSAFDALGGFYVNGVQTVLPTGILAPGSVANAAAFAANLKPIEVWTYSTLPASPAANTIVFVTDWPLGGGPTGPRMARWTGSTWVALAAADQIVGQLTAGSIATGAVTASAINVSTLSSISVNAGTITAGTLQNASGTRYLDLSAATANFLSHERLALKHDGSAQFSGVVKLVAGDSVNVVEFYNGATKVAGLSTVHYTTGSGFDSVDFNFPSNSRSFSILAQSNSFWLQNLNSSGTASAGIQMDSTMTLFANTSLMLQSGGGGALGFFGASGQAKQTLTGVKAGGTALANLITLLAGHGILTDSTT